MNLEMEKIETMEKMEVKVTMMVIMVMMVTAMTYFDQRNIQLLKIDQIRIHIQLDGNEEGDWQNFQEMMEKLR